MQKYKNPRLCVDLIDYYRLTTVDQRCAAIEVYGCLEQTLISALWISAQIFSMCGFDLDRVIGHTEEVCYGYLHEEFSHDIFVVENELEDAIIAVAWAVGDMYPAILKYAEYGITQGYDLEWVKDAILTVNWNIISNTDEGDDEWDEVHVIVKCPEKWRFYGYPHRQSRGRIKNEHTKQGY